MKQRDQMKERRTSLAAPLLLIVTLLFGAPLLLFAGFKRVVKINPRSREWQAKVYLKGIAQAQHAYFDKHHTYATSFEELDITPEKGSWPDEGLEYVLILDPTPRTRTRDSSDGGLHSVMLADTSVLPWKIRSAEIVSKIPPALLARTGVVGTCPHSCRAFALAAGNIDQDDVIDLWMVYVGEDMIDAGVPAMVPTQIISDTANWACRGFTPCDMLSDDGFSMAK